MFSPSILRYQCYDSLEIWIAPWATRPSHTSFLPHARKNWSSMNTEWKNFLISHLWIYKTNTGKWCLNKRTAASGMWPSNISNLNSFIRCGRKDRKVKKKVRYIRHLALDKIYGSALLAAVWKPIFRFSCLYTWLANPLAILKLMLKKTPKLENPPSLQTQKAELLVALQLVSCPSLCML